MAQAKGNAVAVVYDLLEKVLKPTIDVTREWGDLPKTAIGVEIKRDFEGDFQSFVDFFQSMHRLILVYVGYVLTVTNSSRNKN